MRPFIPGTRRNARKKPDAEWEALKSDILEKYETPMSVEAVKLWLEQEHGFIVSNRQLGRRIRDVWGVRRYRPNSARRRSSPELPPAQGEPSGIGAVPVEEHGSGTHAPFEQQTPIHALTAAPRFPPASPDSRSFPVQSQPSVPQLDSPDARLRYRRLAEILRTLGDAHSSFIFHAALWDVEHLTPDIYTCVRTAQTQAQADKAREMLASIGDICSEDEDSWIAVTVDLLLAHTYDRGPDQVDAIDLIKDTIKDIIDDNQGQANLRRLAKRGPPLDVPAYSILSAALARYNHCLDLEHGDRFINAQSVLEQFVDQHMTTDPRPDLDVLPSCLRWCRDVLRRSPATAPDVGGADENPVAEACSVLCTLWHSWLAFGPPHSPLDVAAADRDPSLAPTWSDKVEAQLGISVTEFLGAVVSMIMAEAPRPEIGDEKQPLLERARAGASELAGLSSEALLRRFLDRVRAMNQPLTVPPDGEHGFYFQNGAVDTGVIAPFRDFAAKTLGIDDLPALEPGVVVCPLVATDSEQLTYDDMVCLFEDFQGGGHNYQLG
ncbi:uncharacterized protein THITE_2152081 [Thermothielavioides terrestris NRRL 8126]|uniref:Clr5 domain-containing protein n=1 Tax=Thermothielavioides terrestris (strain ATCC 38088 / NRRL 8126) TaxID=578455 RepID=G2RDD5_THETT|nr:uncharacterized protein THITE_2152081 [Thermothielavioides terrestris NRRL 8126]AEO70774.1 hypothetical protein THITE_2152081 [Thermothielavioides terrestris NRRL 8126]